MAGLILMPVAEQILGKATDLALEQIGLLWNFKSELQKLKAAVSTIQAVLRDAEEKQFHNHQVKDWLEKLSDAMYDADDLLDDLATEARRKAVLVAATDDDDDGGRRIRAPSTTCWSLVCFLMSSLPQQLWYDLMMAHAIKAIRDRLDNISKDKETLHLQVDTTEEKTLPSRETDSRPPMIVVGRENDKKNIIELLLNSNLEANISVVPIVGMGGLGKSTLAQLVLHDDQVQNHFDIKAWVYVSERFDVKMILLKMLESITRQKVEDLTLDALQAQLHREIKGKKFLFVLDDAWEESRRCWESLGNYLTVGALGSKVLVTTRSTRVAEFAGGALKSSTSNSSSIVKPYQLNGLSKDDSWKILEAKALPRQVPAEVQDIGKQVLEKCRGVPLAVSTIAGVLADSTDPKMEWPSFLEKGLSSIMNEGGEVSITVALQVSFNILPSHMKHCFTYCGLFEKGFRIKIPMLVRLWVAQGYIESEGKGYNCFRTLWWRSFFQEVEMDGLGNFSTCRMHDLMHDLADSIAGENIKRSSSVLTNVPSKARHLCITYDGNDNLRQEDHDSGDELRSISKVRTLICFKSLSSEELEQIINNVLRLRVLVICSYDADAYTSLNLVGKLKHLRYLGIMGFYNMKNLPYSIVNLVNLQVLNLIGGESLQELPRDIKKLVNLKHLDPDQTSWKNLRCIPKGIGELKFLQTLPIFVVWKRSRCTCSACSDNDVMVPGAGLGELEGLNTLCGELTIKGLENLHSLKEGVYVFKEKLHLQSLILDWSRNYANMDDVDVRISRDEGILENLWPHPNLKKLTIDGKNAYEGIKLPSWLSTLVNLVEFSLIDCMRWEYLPAQLHHMTKLKKLIIINCPMLKGINDDGDYWDSSPDNSITRLSAEEEEDEEWPQFQCLVHLCIRHCPRLTRLPKFPTVEGDLELSYVKSLAPLARTMKMRGGGIEGGVDTTVGRSSSSALVHPLSKLSKLTLKGIGDDLESLSHHDLSSCLVSLQWLDVYRCRVVKLPSSLCSSTYLMKIDLYSCRFIEYLPPLHELQRLKELVISDCARLKGCWWKKGKGNNDSNNDHNDKDDYYNFDPSMEREEETEEDEETEDEWPHFPCLSTLDIADCPKLTRIPLFPTVEGNLSLGNIGEALFRTMKMKPVVAAHFLHSQQNPSSLLLGTSLVTPLSKVKELVLERMNELESLPEEGLRNLTSLQRLTINRCRRLASLPPAMQDLTSLQILDIKECPLLTERCRGGEGEDWPNISHIPNIKLDEKILQGSVSDSEEEYY